jgi:CRISPR/Cas system CSM-associated protein Csm2 small subunit
MSIKLSNLDQIIKTMSNKANDTGGSTKPNPNPNSPFSLKAPDGKVSFEEALDGYNDAKRDYKESSELRSVLLTYLRSTKQDASSEFKPQAFKNFITALANNGGESLFKTIANKSDDVDARYIRSTLDSYKKSYKANDNKQDNAILSDEDMGMFTAINRGLKESETLAPKLPDLFNSILEQQGK